MIGAHVKEPTPRAGKMLQHRIRQFVYGDEAQRLEQFPARGGESRFHLMHREVVDPLVRRRLVGAGYS